MSASSFSLVSPKLDTLLGEISQNRGKWKFDATAKEECRGVLVGMCV